MPWLQVRFPAHGAQAEQIAAALEEAGAISVSTEHVGDDAWVETDWDERPVWRDSRVTGLFPEHVDVADILSGLRAQLGAEPPEPAVDLLADQDWACSWMANYKPLQMGPRLWICPSWIAPPDPDAVNVILDPGMAFGTGDHPTTALCLEWIAGEPLAGLDLIDYGCGSGILSVAALKLGARSALGTDIDPQALEVSRRNAVLNGVAGRFQALLPAELPATAGADVVIANILARPLIELAPRIQALVRPGGRLALSGMLREQADEVAPHYMMNGFTLERRERANWVLLAGRRR